MYTRQQTYTLYTSLFYPLSHTVSSFQYCISNTLYISCYALSPSCDSPGLENPPFRTTGISLQLNSLWFLLFFYCTPSLQPMQHDEHHRALLDAHDDGASSSSSSTPERATIPVTTTTVDYDKSEDNTTSTTTQPATHEEQQRLLDNDSDPERALNDNGHTSSWQMEVQEPNQPVYISKWVNFCILVSVFTLDNMAWMIRIIQCGDILLLQQFSSCSSCCSKW